MEPYFGHDSVRSGRSFSESAGWDGLNAWEIGSYGCVYENDCKIAQKSTVGFCETVQLPKT